MKCGNDIIFSRKYCVTLVSSDKIFANDAIAIKIQISVFSIHISSANLSNQLRAFGLPKNEKENLNKSNQFIIWGGLVKVSTLDNLNINLAASMFYHNINHF